MPDTEKTREELAHAREATTELTATVADLATKFNINVTLTDNITKVTDRIKKVTYLLVGLIVVMLIGATVATVYIWHQQQQIKQFLADGQRSRESIARIDDCLRPDGGCFKTNRENQTSIIVQITDTNHNGKSDTAEILAALEDLQKALGR